MTMKRVVLKPCVAIGGGWQVGRHRAADLDDEHHRNMPAWPCPASHKGHERVCFDRAAWMRPPCSGRCTVAIVHGFGWRIMHVCAYIMRTYMHQ
jgi:hypothetical protein